MPPREVFIRLAFATGTSGLICFVFGYLAGLKRGSEGPTKPCARAGGYGGGSSAPAETYLIRRPRPIKPDRTIVGPG